MPATPPPSLEELAKYPRMTGWFAPGLLAKLLWRVVVSDMFGQYADRRLMVAALDPVRDTELVDRAKQFMPPSGGAIEACRLDPDGEGAIWIDFVADLGDGFDATYAVATLMAQETLRFGDVETKRGQILVMGGDEVYPNASEEAYRTRLRDPYDWAFPDPNTNALKGPPVYAIPGNHDWYDGLVLFLALFSRKEHLHLGGWRTHQRRSYFALQLTERWWIWAMDAQLADDVDQPQKEYFMAIAKAMPKDANVILCGPEPGWLYTLKEGSKSLSVIDYVAKLAMNRNPGRRIPLVLSGDTHHYSRYVGLSEADGGETQFITSGGGGAFLHSTHQLKDTVDLDRVDEGVSWLGGLVRKLTLGRKAGGPAGDDGAACYPTRKESVDMLAGNVRFPLLNPGFAAVLGVCYWLAGLATQSLGWDYLYIVPILFILGFWGYTKRQEGDDGKVRIVSAINGAVHSAASILLAHFFVWLNARLGIGIWTHLGFLVFLAEMVVVGGAAAAFIFGLYLYVSSRWLDLNHNDAFSSMRLDSHRGFLRLRIKGDEVTIFPIGLDRTPARNEWRLNTKGEMSPPPRFVPRTPLSPHLVEAPIVVRTGAATPG